MRILSCILILWSALSLRAQQSAPGVEGWRIHASFRTNNDIAEGGRKIYVGSAFGMFSFDEESREIAVFSKVNLLSDATIGHLEYDDATSTLVVGYQNANIDLIRGEKTYNVSAILEQSIIGDKTLYNITCFERKAYISCGFGIAVIDLDQRKLVDSYMNLGPGGASVPVYDVAFLNGAIYAGTTNGIMRASTGSSNLSDYQSWQLVQASTYPCMNMETFNNKLYADKDSTLYTFDGLATWSIFPGAVSQRIYDMKVGSNKLTVVYLFNIDMIAKNGQVVSTPKLAGANAATLGKDGMLYAIIPDQYLVSLNPASGLLDYYGPSGPSGSTAIRMAYANKSVWVAAGQINNYLTSSGWSPLFSPNKLYRFNNNEWFNYTTLSNPVFDKPWDIVDVAIDPQTGNAFLASLGAGVLEMTETTTIAVYDTANSSLRKLNSGIPGYTPLYASGLDFDGDGNLWVSNYGAVNPLSVKTKEGRWYSFPVASADNTSSHGFVTCDDNGSKWIVNTRGAGLIVFNENKTYASTSDDRVRNLTDAARNGLLPSKTVFCVTKEAKGEIWVGTAKGLCRFTNPSNIFNEKVNSDAEQIVIKTGLVYSNFLSNEPVYCIRTDAANRKWIGTAHGVWLVSEDGYTVIRNFTVNNSPLPAESVHEIGINNETGEVFFATEKGMISYMGTATDGGDVFGNVLVYPNPVRPDYNGLIVIRGLAADAYVKITDISGNMVYETKANGGTATWNGMNFSGRRAATGVYLVFAATQDGEQTHVSKILFIN